MDRLRVSEKRLRKEHMLAKTRMNHAREVPRSHNPNRVRHHIIHAGLDVVRLEIYMYGNPHNNYVQRVWFLRGLGPPPFPRPTRQTW
jgi:hypothetical protein